MTTTYADYTFYTTTYLGTAIASADFAQLALRASARIDQMTFQRAAAVVEAAEDTDQIALIKMATCAVAEELQAIAAGGEAGGIQAESVGSHSVTYNEASEKQQSIMQKLQDAAKVYLDGTGLMFRGFSSGEYGAH